MVAIHLSRSAPFLSPTIAEASLRQTGAITEPFRTAAEAWFWTVAALVARHDGARIGAHRGAILRPCEPDDVVKCFDLLYRRHRIGLAHARVLRAWGERGLPPDQRYPTEQAEAVLWQEALGRLEWLLRIKGIVAEVK